MCILALFLALAVTPLAQSSAEGRQSFVIHDSKVTFNVPADWVIFRRDSNADGDIVIFQVKNPVDEGTPDSANVFIRTYGDPKLTVESLANSRAAYVSSLPGGLLMNRFDGETKNTDVLYQYAFRQGFTPYTGLDRIARRGEVLVQISVAFPLLEKTTQKWTGAFISETNALISNLKVAGTAIGKTSTIREDESR